MLLEGEPNLGANYLFVAAEDIYYSDNSNSIGNYGVRITVAFVRNHQPSCFSLQR